MKEQFLSDGDRAALQALVPLAGALGVGTIFALFFGGRRKAGLAVFELFAIVAVLTAAGTTAYLSISLLHRGTAITSHELAQTATPLLVAAMLLVVVSVFARLPGSMERLLTLVPLALAGAVIAAFLAGSTWSVGPENASLVAVAILAIGALIGLCAWALERLDVRWDHRVERRRLAELYGAGYLPDERPLRFAVPQGKDFAASALLGCWSRDGRFYFDLTSLRQLRTETSARWHALSLGEARRPAGAAILVRVEIRPRIPFVRSRPLVRLLLLEPARGGDESVREVRRTARTSSTSPNWASSSSTQERSPQRSRITDYSARMFRGDRRGAFWLAALMVASMLAGCGSGSSSDPATMSDRAAIDFRSPGVGTDGVISPQVSCGAGTLWLPLKWGAVPKGTAELAIYIGRVEYENVDGAKKFVAPFGALVYGIDPALHGIAANTFPQGVGPAGYYGRSCPSVRTGQDILLALLALDRRGAAPPSLTADFGTRLAEETLRVEQPATSSEPAMKLLDETLAVGRITATYGPK